MSSNDSSPTGPSRREGECGAFATTHWSLVARAAQPDSADGKAALEQLCRTYWYPLYCFSRRRYHTRQEAEDLTQGFFADFLARGAVAHAEVARGRFRTFLLCSFRNFCSHEQARAQAIKRGGAYQLVSFDELEKAGARFETEKLHARIGRTDFRPLLGFQRDRTVPRQRASRICCARQGRALRRTANNPPMPC